jgi:hypothetical protein
MNRKVFAAVALTALAPLGLLAAQEGDKGLDVKGQIKIGNHAVKMEAGKLYEIRAQGRGFRPIVRIKGNFSSVEESFYEDAVTHFLVPTGTMEYRLYVTVDTSGFGQVPDVPAGPLDYTLKVTRIPFSDKPLLKRDSSLTAEDPLYANWQSDLKTYFYYKAFPVKLEADRFYIIDMVRKEIDKVRRRKEIDPFLYLEDAKGRILAQDDDGRDNLNARIIFKPDRSGDYRIIASTLRKATGPFTLTVRKQLKEKE